MRVTYFCVGVCVRARALACVGSLACMWGGWIQGACMRVRARVALLIQHVKRMRLIIMASAVASLAPPIFLTLSHKRHDF